MKRAASLFLLALALLLAVPAGAQERAPVKDEPIVWNNVNLYLVTKWAQDATGKKFLISDRPLLEQKRITFISDKIPTKPEECFALYESILQMSGFLLAKVGTDDQAMYKVIQSTVSIKYPTEFVEKDKEIKPEDKFITRLFAVEYIAPQDVFASLAALVTDPKGVIPIPGANAILVMDYDYNVERIGKLIKEMDRPKKEISIEKIELQRALATDVEKMLNALMQTIISTTTVAPVPTRSAGSAGEQFKIVADTRTNSVIVLAQSKERMDQIMDLIKKLDAEAIAATTGAYLYHLKHTNAVDIVRTLNALYGITTSKEGLPGRAPTQPMTTASGQPAQPRIVSEGPLPSPQQGAPIIVADEPTNSLIIVTDKNTYQALSDLIQKLDVKKPQVLIKASIVEVNSRDTLDFGTELATIGKPGDRGRGFGATSFGMSTLVDTDGDSIPDARLPVDTTGIVLGVFKERFGSIPAMISALKVKDEVEILSEPEALTNDNEKAILSVTDKVYPVVTTTTTGIATTSAGQPVEAGTILEITPHISEGQYLRLETKLTIDKFTGESTNPAVPPNSSKRELQTTITVPNARTVVIGGLVTHDLTDRVDGVPVLSSIPILGLAFSKTKKTNVGRTLYLFITPYILYDEKFGDIQELSGERVKDIEGKTKRPAEFYKDRDALPAPKPTFEYRIPPKEE